MPQVRYQCKTCPTILDYNLVTNRRVYCKPCKRLADNAAEVRNKKLRVKKRPIKCRSNSGAGDWDRM